MFIGSIYCLVKKLFGIIPNIAGGVCWYLEWDKIDDMYRLGFERITRALIPAAEAGNLSKRYINR